MYQPARWSLKLFPRPLALSLSSQPLQSRRSEIVPAQARSSQNQFVSQTTHSRHTSRQPVVTAPRFSGRQFHCTRHLGQPAQPSSEDTSKPWEEETLADYDPDDFYPVHIGQVLGDRYKVIGKLGFGSSSTTWLAKDTKNEGFVCLKVYVKARHQTNWEVMIYRHLRSIKSSHPGTKHIRGVLDDVELTRKDGSKHACLVHPPLLTTLWEHLKSTDTAGKLSVNTLRGILRVLFQALDFLHSEANLTHCDVKASNLMLTVKDPSVLCDFESAERRSPSAQKTIDDERTIYASRALRLPSGDDWGTPVLCDFGESRLGSTHKWEEILPPMLRPPEILLEMEWGHAVDMWSAGCMIWDVFENQRLFNGHTHDGSYNERIHLSELVAYFGPPPMIFQLRSPVSHLVFDKEGDWKGPPELPNLSKRTFEESEIRLQGSEKKAFLEFVLSMLRWQPEERITAKNLLENPWLNGRV